MAGVVMEEAPRTGDVGGRDGLEAYCIAVAAGGAGIGSPCPCPPTPLKREHDHHAV